MKGFCGVCPLGETPDKNKTNGCSGTSTLRFEPAEQPPACMTAPNRTEWLRGSNPSTNNTGDITDYKCSTWARAYGTERAPNPDGCFVLKNSNGYAGYISPGGGDVMDANTTKNPYSYRGFFTGTAPYGLGTYITKGDANFYAEVNVSNGMKFANLFQFVDYATAIPAARSLTAGSVAVGGRCATHADCQTVFGSSPTYKKAVYCINNQCQEKVACKNPDNAPVPYGWGF